MLKIHKPFSKHELLLIPITSICIISGLLGFYCLTYTPELSHAETVTYEPEETRTMADIGYMQEVTPEVCQNSELNKQYTLIDSRDKNPYTVARIKNQTNDDSNCWMTQSLRLVGRRVLTPDDSDVINNYNLPASVVLDSENDSPKQFSESDQYQSKVYYGGDVEYGAYYNWYAATAGTGDASIKADGDNASSSICPKGWKLPTGGSNSDFYRFANGLSLDVARSEPYKMRAGGVITDSYWVNSGTLSRYQSSTAYSDSDAYGLNYQPGVLANLDPVARYLHRYVGLSVRCILGVNTIPINNINIMVNPTISLDMAGEVEVRKSETNPSTANLDVKVSSNQKYTVGISAEKPELSSETSNVTIPAMGGLLNTNVNGWGIRLSSDTSYKAITSTPVTFYTASGAEIKTVPFTIGISTAPDLPNGEYSTNITITATQN